MTTSTLASAGRGLRTADRWQALDLLRLIAVVLMVQGHTFSALLDPAFRDEPWHVHHAYVHGLTAPLFFFASGLAFGVATFKHWSSHTRWGVPVRRRLGRYAWLLFIGYMLNLPHSSFSYLLSGPSPETAEAFLKVDALQQIAVALILIEGLVLLLKEPRRMVAAVLLLGALFVFAAPWAWELSDTESLPLAVLAYLNGSTGSIFPTFPWTGFICAGVVTAYVSVDARGGGQRKPLISIRLGGAGLFVWLLVSLLEQAGLDAYDGRSEWESRPMFFLTRIALVLLLFSALCAYETLRAGGHLRRAARSLSHRDSILHVIGQETLVIYVFHLLLIYGLPFVGGLTGRYEATLSIGAAAGTSAALLAASVAFALLWRHARQRWPQGFPRFRYALAACALLAGASLPPPGQTKPIDPSTNEAGTKFES